MKGIIRSIKRKVKKKLKKRKAKKAKAKANKKALAKGRADAMAAAESMGVTFNSKGQVTNLDVARSIAQGAAVSAAAAMGVNIMKADGKIDTKKAIGAMLGFSIDKDGKDQQSETAREVQEATMKTARALRADIFDADGKMDTAKALAVAMIAVQLDPTNEQRPDREKVLQNLNKNNTDAFMTVTKKTRQEAVAMMEKMKGSSVVKDGRIDAQAALKVREESIAQAKSDAFIAKRKEHSRGEAAQLLSKKRPLYLKK